MSSKTRLSVLLLSTPVLAFVLIGGLLGHTSAWAEDDSDFRHLKVFQDVLGLVMSNYVEEVEVDRVMEGALRGLAEGLDPDSAYLSPAQVKEFESKTAAAEGDLGIQMTRQYYLRIIATRDGSPAAAAGLQTGDYVRAIDGRSTRDLSVFEGMRLLRGTPGSKVTLTIIRGNAAEPHEVALVRERPEVPPVTSKLLDVGAGYIRVPAFGPKTADSVKRHAGDLAKAGAKTLVIDLRRVAEGDLDHGVATARLFVDSGTLVVDRGSSGRRARRKRRRTR